jgi:hypothetical protein
MSLRLNYVKEAAVDELRRVLVDTGPRYKEDKAWLEQYFDGRPYLAESRVEVAALPALKFPDKGGELYELENTITLHSALKDLTPSQAADERLWVWLAHGPYWEYMRNRWPAENATEGQLSRYLLEHYFLGDARTLVRHGLARFWWYGHCTYDAGAEDPYAFTRLLLRTSDARQSLTERRFWRNREVLRGLLRRVAQLLDEGFDFYVPRERFRRLCKTFNTFGGTVLLDALDDKDIFALVDDIKSTELAGVSKAAA